MLFHRSHGEFCFYFYFISFYGIWYYSKKKKKNIKKLKAFQWFRFNNKHLNLSSDFINMVIFFIHLFIVFYFLADRAAEWLVTSVYKHKLFWKIGGPLYILPFSLTGSCFLLLWMRMNISLWRALLFPTIVIAV